MVLGIGRIFNDIGHATTLLMSEAERAIDSMSKY